MFDELLSEIDVARFRSRSARFHESEENEPIVFGFHVARVRAKQLVEARDDVTGNAQQNAGLQIEKNGQTFKKLNIIIIIIHIFIIQ